MGYCEWRSRRRASLVWSLVSVALLVGHGGDRPRVRVDAREPRPRRRRRRLGENGGEGSVADGTRVAPRGDDATTSVGLASYDEIRSRLPEGADPVDHYPYSMLRDYADDQPLDASDTAFFWHVPKSAGSNLKQMFGTCFDLSIASEYGRHLCEQQKQRQSPEQQQQQQQQQQQREALRVCANELGRFVNVNTSYGDGIGEAKRLGLVTSGLADVIVSVDFRSAAALFDPERRGRAFAVFRHPVDRVVSTFHYLARARWENHYNPALADMTVVDYARSPFCPSDWSTRSLLGLLGQRRALTEDDLAVAEEIVRRKILVLMVDDFESALRRLSSYFGWDGGSGGGGGGDDSDPATSNCVNRSIGSKENGGVFHDKVEEGSEAWDAILERNRFDLRLYDHAKTVYAQQRNTIFADANLIK